METRQELQRRLVKALEKNLESDTLSENFKARIFNIASAMAENAMNMGREETKDA